MKHLLLSSLAVLLNISILFCQKTIPLISYVDPFIGTGGTGHTFPGATLPHGMVQLSPDTRTEGWESCAGYYFSDPEILGFTHTHLSGTGVPDLGDVLIMPFQGKANIQHYDNGKPYMKQAIDKGSEKASPGFYSVKFKDASVAVELTCTQRVGWHKYQFSNPQDAEIFIDLEHRDQLIEAAIHIDNSRQISGFRISKGWARKQYVYFVMKFSADIKLSETIVGKNSIIIKPMLKDKESLLVKVAISPVSIEGAMKNMDKESPNWDFNQIKSAANNTWENELSTIEVKSDNNVDMTNFYTALYHVHIAPNIFCDVDSMYRAMDDKIYKAKDFTPYTVFSIWDTYRATHPLFTIIDIKRTKDYVKTMLDHYEKAGHLPVWELDGNETWCMIGYHSVSVITDAFLKGIKDFNTETALKAMLESANAKRFEIDQYAKLGYIPAEKGGESVSKTLEYAYDDWCISRFANGIGNKEVYRLFNQRAQNYKNLLDPKSGFFRARSNNSFLEPFLPSEINMHYTEGNAWHYGFTAVQDLTNFSRYLGGDKGLEHKLDLLFTTQDKLTGRDQSDVTGLIGQYAHGNEPSHNIAYLYNHTTSPWKTQELTRRICTDLYKNDAETGLCGNEDCGQMSAWYVLSAMGMYQVCPGNDYYDLSSTLFDQVKIHLENGKYFTIKANNNSHNNKYIQSVSMAGRPLNRSYILYGEIMNGTPMQFEMTNEPNKTLWQTEDCRFPSEIGENHIVPLPFVVSPSQIFTDVTSFTLNDLEPAATMYYAFDENKLTTDFTKYQKPVVVNTDTTVYFYAKMPNGQKSQKVSTKFHKLDNRIVLLSCTPYSSQYTGSGKSALLDHIRGGNDYKSLAWQGFQGSDLDIVVDMGEIIAINEIGLGFLQDQKSWIFFPKSIIVEISEDGLKYKNLGTSDNKIDMNIEGTLTQDMVVQKPTKARYIKLKATSSGIIPDWHPGAGNPSWIFADELIIK